MELTLQTPKHSSTAAKIHDPELMGVASVVATLLVIRHFMTSQRTHVSSALWDSSYVKLLQ